VERAAAGLEQVLATAQQIGDEGPRSSALSGVAQGYAGLGDVERAAAGLEQVLATAGQIGDEGLRSYALSGVAEGYVQVMRLPKAYDLLAAIAKDQDFVEVSAAMFRAGETLPESKASDFLRSALYRIVPLASQRSRRVYLTVVGQALPFLVEHLSPEDVRPVLTFLEEQWEVSAK
jgi:hypothetical protein